jgi:hypothetical protein
MRDLIPALLDEYRYAGTGIHALALTSCLDNVASVNADEVAEQFTAAWWSAEAKAIEKEVLQLAIEYDQKDTVADKDEESEEENEEGEEEAEEKKEKGCIGRILPYMTVYSNVSYVGEDFKSDLRYSPRFVAAIGAAIEEDVFGFIAKKRKEEREEKEKK